MKKVKKRYKVSKFEKLLYTFTIFILVISPVSIVFSKATLAEINFLVEKQKRERARSIDSILEQYSETVKPMHEEFVEPSKKYADVIIPRGGENQAGINMLQEYLKRKQNKIIEQKVNF